MSTNKTQNYQLHSWVAGDKFLRSEMNENFAKLDAAARVVVGSYTGDGETTRVISLGFTPRAVLVVNDEGQMGVDNYSCKGGLCLPGLSPRSDLVTLVQGGFQVREKGTYITANGTHYTYGYLAVQ